METKQKDRKKNLKVGVNISDVPLHLVKDFSRLARTKYNDMYWVTLLDLYRKAEAYDVLLQSGMIEEIDEGVEAEPKQQVPKTIGGD